MIQANELRIGNLLQSNENVILKVVELTENNISTFVIDRSKYPLKNGWSLKPIQLTEEILLKCGFENPAFSFIGDLFRLTEWDKYPLNWSVALNKNGAVLVKKLKYLHQLQNLYFALTNEELTINL